jgi:hypothetical protein
MITPAAWGTGPESEQALMVFRPASLVVEDTAGAVLDSVPLTLVVTPDTPAEEGPPEQGRGRLAVAPNPVRGAVAVTLTLDAPARVRLALYDVLGREAALLHDGPAPAGASTYDVAPGRLPAGVYVVRAEWPEGMSTARLVVAR